MNHLGNILIGIGLGMVILAFLIAATRLRNQQMDEDQ